MAYSFQGATSDLALQARFRRAERHSRRVRFLRRTIPVAVALALGVILLISVFNPFRLILNLPIEVGNLVVSGTKVTMESPRLSGYTPDQRGYEVSAKAWVQDVTDPTKLELQQPYARIELEDKSTVAVNARVGFYNTQTQILKLEDDIIVKTSNGYEGKLKEAIVDIGKGTLKSDKPVFIKMPEGTLEAQRMSVAESGDVVVFDGGLTLTLAPTAAPAATPAALSQPPTRASKQSSVR
jgi:lipopolysaccharide export system protein LptC